MHLLTRRISQADSLQASSPIVYIAALFWESNCKKHGEIVVELKLSCSPAGPMWSTRHVPVRHQSPRIKVPAAFHALLFLVLCWRRAGLAGLGRVVAGD